MSDIKPVVLVVLDGWGEWNVKVGNPLVAANLPTITSLNNYYPKLLLSASGISVGLPWGEMGNSEVGHMTLGSGQIIYQFLPTITNSLQDGSFFINPAFLAAIDWAKTHNSKLHLLGLVSDGGVHAHIDHLLGLLDLAKRQGLEKVFVHAITDGRDTNPKSAKNYLQKVLTKIESLGIGKIATICGRHYGMDRNSNWDRTLKAWQAWVLGEGKKSDNVLNVVDEQYQAGITDEYFEPVVLTEDGLISKDDAVIFFNYRKDRARQVTEAFLQTEKTGLKVQALENIHFVGFVEYEPNLLTNIAFPEQKITTRLGEVISGAGLKQLRIAETEKYAHVTYFFNGGNEQPFVGEDRMLVKSADVNSYADLPEMSIYEVNKKLIATIKEQKHSFVLVNYANPDMVGHTGDFKATIKAVEIVDKCLDELVTTVQGLGGTVLITADHGNAEELVDIQTGEKNTEHSNNPVPAWLVTPTNFKHKTQSIKDYEANGMLVDVAPTILELLSLPAPKNMVGRSLLEAFNKYGY